MYDEARNFSKSLDTASSSDTKSAKSSKDPLPPDLKGSKDKEGGSNPVTKGMAKTGETPYGVKPTSAPAGVDAAASTGGVVPTTPSLSSGVSIPATGSANDRMMAKAQEYAPHITAAANRYSLPPELIAGVIWQESRGNPRAVSHCGAMGLMQLMPATAASLGVGNAFDAAQNIDGGAKYLRQMLDKFNGRVDFAVAAYNAGPGNVRKWLNRYGDPRTSGRDVLTWIEAIPFEETRGYVQRVLENSVVYDTINPTMPPASSSVHLSSYLGKTARPG